MNRISIILAIFILTCSSAWAKCIVNTDCTFEYVPALISDGYSRGTGLTLVAVDEIDVRYKFDDDTVFTDITEGNQSDSCPPTSGQVCMVSTGYGTYRVMLDASFIPAAEVNKRLCIDMNDVQVARTVADEVLCQDVVEGVTLWDTYEIVDLTNESGDQNPTTTSSDTNLTWTVNFTNTTPQPIMYFPTVNEDARQSASCNVQGLRTEVTGYNTATKVITYRVLPEAPDYRCIFRNY